MGQVIDLSIILDAPPLGSPPDAIARVELQCEEPQLTHSGHLLTNLLTNEEHEGLRWYLEEYWKWPYLEFAARGKQVEAMLIDVGKRLYHTIFGSVEAQGLLEEWRKQLDGQHQISVVSELPEVLSLPWELLHDAYGFLALRREQPISIVRRLPRREQPAHSMPFARPLRVLLVSARPEGTGFVDPRGIAHELLDEIQGQVEAGAIEIEFVRPPTFSALNARLSDRKRPIHMLHFDGHGAFSEERHGQGVLIFETEAGWPNAVKASDLARVLRDSGVRLVLLTACQSATSGTDTAFSSVAAQLIYSGADAVVAMSASVLVASATRYVEALYRELVAGVAVPIAQERARQALYDDPRRHPHRHRRDEEGRAVELIDWWLPHLYQHRPVILQPMSTGQGSTKPHEALSSQRLSEQMPAEPRYGFTGRARELLQIERALMRGKLVVISGFGGIGKTALAREAADWLTRTRMYDGACFVSFEHRGDTVALLSVLGHYLGVYDGYYNPHDSKAALMRLRPVLKEKRTAVIADNLESVLPSGETPLEATERTQLWDILLELVQMGAGILLTSQDGGSGEERLAPGKRVMRLQLQGLNPEDAYALATRLLDDLEIDRSLTPYAELRDLLVQLDHHPLAIQLVLPALREVPLSAIRNNFTEHLPKFVDDWTTGRNRSLLASLDYSLRRIGDEQRALLLRLAPFEGGANEDDLLSITEIPEPAWVLVRSELERAALLTVEPIHKSNIISFLHFHPLLVPYLRGQAGALDADLQTRYAWRYHERALQLYFEDDRNPQAVRALARRELPNLMRALSLLSQAGELRAVSEMVNSIILFLGYFGLQRERDHLRQQEAVALASAQPGAPLTYVEWLYESGLAQEKYNSDVHASYNRFMALLKRIEALPAGITLGPGTYQHCTTLDWVARCLNKRGQPTAAETRIREALSIIDTRIDQRHDLLSVDLRGVLYSDLGHTLRDQGRYSEAREAYEESSRVAEGLGNKRAEAGQLMHLGALSVDLWEYPEARSYFSAALELFKISDELEGVAGAWFELGVVAEHQKEWAEAERCFREALAITEQRSEDDRAASCCNWLARIALAAGRTAEAEGWWKRSVEIIERMHPGGPEHAGYLTNLVFLLLNEVRVGHAQDRQERLAEARDYAERALRMRKALEASEEIWTTLQMLADIADAEGWTAAARDYRRQARETFAALESKRYHMDRVFGEATDDIAAVASGDLLAWASAEAELRNLEGAGLHIAEAVQRIWAGERDWHLLVEGIEPPAALLVLRILEKITQPGNVQPAETLNITPVQVLASLPITFREAFEHRDIAALQQALGGLSSVEAKRRVSAAIRYLFSDEGSASYIDPQVHESEQVLQGIAAVATGESTQRDMLKAVLIELEETSGSKLRESVQRIWQGEREESALTAGLNRVDAAMVRRVLEIIAERSAMQKMSEAELIASLPGTTRGALERGENVAFEQALEGLPFNERQRVRTALYYLKLKLEEGERERGAQDIDALVREAEPWLDRLAAVALGNPTHRGKAEEFLSGLQARGHRFPERVQRIWEGERDEAALFAGLGALDTALLRRVLAFIAQTVKIARSFESLLQGIAAVATGDEVHRGEIEAALADQEEKGLQLARAVWDIWEGERNERALTAQLPILEVIMVRRVLEVMAQTTAMREMTEDELIASLPETIHGAFIAGDLTAFEQAFGVLSFEEQERVQMVMLHLKILREKDAVQRFEPLLQKIATVASGDVAHRSEIEAELADLEREGWQLTEVVQRIWAGERDEITLTSQLNREDFQVMALVYRVLEILALERTDRR